MKFNNLFSPIGTKSVLEMNERELARFLRRSKPSPVYTKDDVVYAIVAVVIPVIVAILAVII